MSELRDVFKQADMTFMYASDFIVSMYEGGYMLAEDLHDRMAGERNIYQVPFSEKMEFDHDFQGAIAFYGKLLPAFLVIQVALLEDCLLEICHAAARQAQVSFEVKLSDPFRATDAILFFEEKLGVRFPEPWPVWDKIREIQKIRDDAVNHAGLQIGRVNLDDSYLVDFNQAIRSFLGELKTYLPGVGLTHRVLREAFPQFAEALRACMLSA